ncbi:MAG: flagellar biosynthesis protein FlhA [Clostridiaceae bacterium]
MEKSIFKNFDIKRVYDVLVPLIVIGIVLMIIIPIPTWLLDILLGFNITISIIIILLTLFATNVLQFSSFPTLLLITTLFRLALNISSTRLILSQANGGKIIAAFGSFVVQNNYVVGLIIFIIIVIIQFVVITNGAGRVAEVSARFTLDALPGKQMSIDADLNAGIINEEQAKMRRNNLQSEVDFYGSMDGASKFVKGDAIAGIIITLINILGGIIIGAVMMKMPIGEAATTYVQLSVGDGLVSQIPALLISTASAILVTKSGGDENFGNQVIRQLTTFPKAFTIASGVLFMLGLIPALPNFLLLSLSAAVGFSAYLLYKEDKKEIVKKEAKEMKKQVAVTKKEPENVMNLISVEPMEIEIGYGLIPLADEGRGGDLLQRIASVRRQCAIDMGILVQPIRIRDNLQLKTNDYLIKIRGTTMGRGELMPNMFLAMDPANSGYKMDGIKTKEPSFGLPAVWINNDEREKAEINGLTVVDPTTVLITHLTEIIKVHSYELLGRQEVKELVDSIKDRYSAVVEELIPNLLTLGDVQKVFQNLLKEGIPIKDLVTIFESLADNARNTKDIELLTEYVRFALGRTICNPHIDENGKMIVSTLSQKAEDMIASNIRKSMQGSFPALDPNSTGKILNSIKSLLETVNYFENQPIILVNPKIRPAFRKLIEMVYPNVVVLSINEIPNDIEIKTEGVVSL